MRRAVRLDGGAVDGGRLARPSALGRRGQHRPPEAAAGQAVVDGGARTIRCRAVAPAAARGENVQDAGTEGPRSEMTCRSSFRSGPGWFLGMNGSITAHRSSESQNRSAIAAFVLQTALLSHKTIALATPWFGSHPSASPPKLVRRRADAWTYGLRTARLRRGWSFLEDRGGLSPISLPGRIPTRYRPAVYPSPSRVPCA